METCPINKRCLGCIVKWLRPKDKLSNTDGMKKITVVRDNIVWIFEKRNLMVKDKIRIGDYYDVRHLRYRKTI